MKICIMGASGELDTYMAQHALGHSHEMVRVCRKRKPHNYVAATVKGRKVFQEHAVALESILISK